MTLSILIATIEKRKKHFEALYEKVSRQIAGNSLSGAVEILFLLDNKEHSIGSKRNKLIDMAKGEFVVFVDDDDDVSDDYVPLVYKAITENPDIDCIGLKGLITFNGKRPRHFIHSLQYKEYFAKEKTLYRPPYHLNPVRREIANKYKFEDISYSEDVDYAMKMLRDGALKKEYFIDKVIYYYHSSRPWIYQFLLDMTEPIRHPLGLKLVNCIRIKRWFGF